MIYYGYYVAQYVIHAPECHLMLYNFIIPLLMGFQMLLIFAIERILP